jgi:hypothetical protein
MVWLSRIPGSTQVALVADHLAQVEADLMDAKRTMILRISSMARRLPAGDPDRAVLEACVSDLTASIRRRDAR